MWFSVVLVIVVIAFYLFSLTIKPKNYPPGPSWYPIVGTVLEVKNLSKKFKGQHLAQQYLSRKYKSDVIGLRNGKENVVVVFNQAAVKAIFKREEFLARPQNFFLYLRNMGLIRGITIVSGRLWQIQRRFVVSHLKYLGLGKRSMEVFLRDEVTEILNLLEENEGKELRVDEIFTVTILNILWAFVAGIRLGRQNDLLNRLLKILEQRTRAFDIAGGLLSPFPWLRFISPEKSGYNLVQHVNAKIKDLILETINEHYANWEPGRNDDLIYAFITEMKSNKDPDSTFTEDQLIMVCLDMFLAGSQITTSTLDYVFFAMILYPEVQEKSRKCIWKAFSKDAHIDYSDRHRVPYIEAVISEVIRMYHVMPITGPRRATKNTVLENYSIPKDTTILINIYSVNHNKDYWKDPEVFRPERFLDSNGNLFYPEYYMPFGTGPTWYPIVGSFLELKRLSKIFKSQHLVQQHLSNKYQSDVIGLRNGKEKVVVVFNNAAVKAIYKRDEFQARPRTFFLYLRNMGIRKGITIVDGKLWQIQRRFVVTHLKYLGLGKRSMEVFLRDEITEILDSLKENEGKEQRVEEIFIVTILSFLWAFVAGTRLSKDDLILNRLLKILHQRTRAFDIAGGLLNPFPWLRFIALENTGYNLVLQMNAQIKELLLETINDHYKDWAPGRTDDLIYSFITEMKSSQDPDSTFTEDQLLMLCLDMFMAGSQITTSTLDYVFFAMILYPEVQENCRTCIQKAFRNDEHINYSDRHRVPYIEAVICEVLRLYHVMPVTGPRRATKDTVLENYSIPKVKGNV
uniref:Probable cytochrome P450 305a1 isoform X2 n=1 Tax=Diabrotica virgifera virgifera TaxID=50390 RepID=A0A6P7G7I3_DIAVI